MKKALVCGAGGFIGSHLVTKLKKEGYWVRGVDLKYPKFSGTKADEFEILDLREEINCKKSLEGKIDEVYQLAADMGGLGFIHSEECNIMRNNILINTHMVNSAVGKGIKKYFFSSSVCLYRDMNIGEPEMKEEGAYPAMPNNEYGWEKLYSEIMLMTYARKFGLEARIARFQNCYGPEGEWRGGREKAPAAISRKIVEVEDGGEIEIWGDGTAVRSFIYIDDMTEAIMQLMRSNFNTPVNIGSPEYVSVNELVDLTAKIAGKRIQKKYISGPVGVQSRNFSNEKIYSIGWRPRVSLKEGMKKTYSWIERQVISARDK
jgi:GDP-D-mannose 3', 5'-epimerase